MAAPTGLISPEYVRQLEGKLIRMDQSTKDKYLESYLDWLLEQAVNAVKTPIKARNQKMMELVDIFVTGKKPLSQDMKDRLHEGLTLLFHCIGDISFDPPLRRIHRAEVRKVKLYNIFTTLMGLPPVEPPKGETSYSVEEMENAVNYLKAELTFFENELAKAKGPTENPIEARDGAEPKV